jgi:hypothetical protein
MGTNIPCRSPIIRFCSVVVPFSMTTHVKDFVLHKPSTASIETPNVVFEFLPLSPRWVDFIISGVADI